MPTVFKLSKNIKIDCGSEHAWLFVCVGPIPSREHPASHSLNSLSPFLFSSCPESLPSLDSVPFLIYSWSVLSEAATTVKRGVFSSLRVNVMFEVLNRIEDGWGSEVESVLSRLWSLCCRLLPVTWEAPPLLILKDSGPQQHHSSSLLGRPASIRDPASVHASVFLSSYHRTLHLDFSSGVWWQWRTLLSCGQILVVKLLSFASIWKMLNHFFTVQH